MDKRFWLGFAILLLVVGGGFWLVPRVNWMWRVVEAPPPPAAVKQPTADSAQFARLKALWEQTGDRAALQRDYARLSQVIADMATAYDRRDGAVLATVVSGAYSDEFIDSQLEAWLADHLAIIQSRLLELDQQPQLVAIIRRLNEAELT
ncbi:MAG: hypothetical protein KDI48_15010, partial [Xanthomonadales bacterium]|nr:hypothetical protein [Xanthomonadales bacterium]